MTPSAQIKMTLRFLWKRDCRLVMSGIDLRTVAELLQDETLAMVMRCAYLAPDDKLDAVERRATTFPGSKTGTKLVPAVEAEKLARRLLK